MSIPMHTYSLFNLNIASEIKFPNWHPVDTVQIPCVSITYGSVNPKGLENAWVSGFSYQMNSENFWLCIPNIARFQISQGLQIIVDPIEKSDDAAIRLFVEEICLDILLRQRQISVLPGHAFKFQNQGLAFAGKPSLGGSILKGVFYKRGYEFISDRYFALSTNSQLLPGFPELDLSLEVLNTIGLKSNQARPVREGIDKFRLPLRHQSLLPQRLDFLYYIKVHHEADLRFMAIETSLQHTYLQLMASERLINTPFYQNDWHAFKPTQLICILVPRKELKVTHLADRIESDVIERVNCYV